MKYNKAKEYAFKFRAWIEVPLMDENKNERLFGFYINSVDIFNAGFFIGFMDIDLEEALEDLPLTNKEKDQIWSYFDMTNESGTSDYFKYRHDDDFEIEQSTGIKDKNGKIIYEGDIVKMNADCMCADIYQQDKPCVVEYGEMGFWFVYPQLEDPEHKSASWNECAEYEVVGHIRYDKDKEKWFPKEADNERQI